MLVKAKGSIVEIAPGVRFVEKNYSRGKAYLLEAISEVNIIEDYEINGEHCKQYHWEAIDIETGEQVHYCITERYEPYGPTLFQSIEDADAFLGKWDPSKHGQIER